MFFIEDLASLAEAKFRWKMQTSVTSNMFSDCVPEIYANEYKGNGKMHFIMVEAAIAQRHNPNVQESLQDLFYEGGHFVVDYLAILEKPPKRVL
jgi:hypothetical protein